MKGDLCCYHLARDRPLGLELALQHHHLRIGLLPSVPDHHFQMCLRLGRLPPRILLKLLDPHREASV